MIFDFDNCYGRDWCCSSPGAGGEDADRRWFCDVNSSNACWISCSMSACTCGSFALVEMWIWLTLPPRPSWMIVWRWWTTFRPSPVRSCEWKNEPVPWLWRNVPTRVNIKATKISSATWRKIVSVYNESLALAIVAYLF